MMFKTVRRFKAAVTGFVNANPDMGEVLQTRMVVERRDGRVAVGDGVLFSSHIRGSCSRVVYSLLGELTDIGR
jgi:acid phosphatase